MTRFVLAACVAAVCTGAFPFAATAAQPAAGCPHQPGSAFSAEIRIAVSDREVQADQVVVRVNGTIPGGGRLAPGPQAGAPPRYVAAVQAMPVQLERDTLKRFNIAPRLIVENANSPDCELRMEATIGGRTWGLQNLTDFTLESRVTMNGRVETSRSDYSVSCFDQDTPIRLAPGEEVAVKEIVPGDLVWNPLLHMATRVKRVIQGTQADETLYRIGIGGAPVLFTAGHPLLTRKGVRVASEITPDDELLGADGVFHRVSVLETRAGDAGRLVYNLLLEAPEGVAAGHWMVTGDIAAGDFLLQEAERGGD
jgi:hypothetical protein